MTKAPSSKTKFAHLTDDLGLSQMECKIECAQKKTIGNDGDDDVFGKSYNTSDKNEITPWFSIHITYVCI